MGEAPIKRLHFNGVFRGLAPKVTIEYASDVTIPSTVMAEIAQLTGDITIILGDGIEGYDNEWCAVITQGETAYNVVLPEIKWGLGIAPTFLANTTTLLRLYYISGTLCGEWVVV